MVEDSGEKKGPGALRPIGLPQPIDVKADERGWPVAVRIGHRYLSAQVMDRWRIDEEWWRGEPISRAYFMVLLEDGRMVTMYSDLNYDRWYIQNCL